MQRDVLSVSPATSLLDVHRLFLAEEIHGAPVIDEDDRSLRGVISTQDLLRAVLDQEELLEPSSRCAADVMVPRVDIFAWSDDLLLRDIIPDLPHVPYSRVPVYHGTIDNITGVVYVREAYERFVEGHADMPLADLARSPFFIPGAISLSKLLRDFRDRRIHMGIVADEFGGTDGLVSIEDAVETIVGEIEDEHDEEEPPEIVAEKGGSFVMDAGTSLDDVAKVVGGEFAKDRDDEEVETIGGMVFSLLGRIPASGEKIAVPGFEIQIIDADQRRIHRLRIRPVATEPSEPEPLSDLPRAARA